MRHVRGNHARARSALSVALCVVPVLLNAQSGNTSGNATGIVSGDATVDSATAARGAFRLAAAAPTLRETLPLLQRAAHAWPTQPAYWTATARIAARLSDSAATREALAALLRLRAVGVIADDSAVARLTAAPSFATLRAALNATAQPIVRGRAIATIADSTVFAEGIDADSASGSLYVASIRHRTIFEVRVDGRVRDLGLSADARVGAIFGVRVAPDGATLYATTSAHRSMRDYSDADTLLDAVIRVRMADGAVIGHWPVPRDGAPHLLGDLAVDANGAVYATDSFAPILFTLQPGQRALSAFRHPLFRSLQGVAIVPGQSRLVVADYSHGLLRVDLSAQTVTRIRDARGTTSLGIDGIILHRNTIVAVQNGIEPARISRFTLDADQRQIVNVEILDQQPSIADEPTIGTLWRGAFVYVANSQWEKFDDRGQRRPGTTLRSTVLLCVPLDSTLPDIAGRPQAATTASTGRKGTRSTDSAPPLSRSCNVSDASSP